MVKFRGIEISIISQFDILKLPEFPYHQSCSLADPFHDFQSTAVTNSIASCYVPIYPGSQIWVEYSIDGPHPQKAAYLFKLLLDDKVVTCWDCTAKHGYQGKMTYNLICEGKNVFTGDKVIRRQAIRFGSDMEGTSQSTLHKDYMELRIHRIEHRQRINDLEKGLGQTKHRQNQAALRLTDGGLLEPGLPQRRYKYQLLDPIDEPYATFRFYYRTYEYLEASGVIGIVQASSHNSTSTEFQDAEPILPRTDQNILSGGGQLSPLSQVFMKGLSPLKRSLKLGSPNASMASFVAQNPKFTNQDGQVNVQCDSFLPPSDSDESLSIVTKDSIVDLPSTVPRSPNSTKIQQSSEELSKISAGLLQSRNRSPQRKLKKAPTINLKGIEFNPDKTQRPLSPFTSGGMLRKMMQSFPPSAPAADPESESTWDQEAGKSLEGHAEFGTIAWKGTSKITSNKKGGNPLRRLIGRRPVSP